MNDDRQNPDNPPPAMDDAGTAGAPEKLEFADEPQASLSTATTVTEPPPQAPKTDAIKEEPKKRKTLLGH
ncbi:MAG: hypothetical protein L6Q71_11535, partial [Planctomycetes bacterium]|nr:hypothetical protein [Planctomycetota bacterium]